MPGIVLPSGIRVIQSNRHSGYVPMRGLALLASAGLLALLLAGRIAMAAGPDSVEFRDGDLTLKGFLYRPDGPGPFPAVVAMHNCGGLVNASGTIATRYRDWALQLVKAGFVVLFPDSYGSRGLANQCAVRNQPVRADRERVADATAARRWLQTQPQVKADRISLLGWSNGATGVLWAVRPRPRHEERSDFRSAVVFYPGCRRLENTAWSARVPTLILVGALDDWTSVQECERMVAGARGRSARASIVVYPGAFHDFDHPSRPAQIRAGSAFSADGSGRFHSGTNATARADALKRVPQWLAR
jgi:dienelactone hydrolase